MNGPEPDRVGPFQMPLFPGNERVSQPEKMTPNCVFTTSARLRHFLDEKPIFAAKASLALYRVTGSRQRWGERYERRRWFVGAGCASRCHRLARTGGKTKCLRGLAVRQVQQRIDGRWIGNELNADLVSGPPFDFAPHAKVGSEHNHEPIR